MTKSRKQLIKYFIPLALIIISVVGVTAKTMDNKELSSYPLSEAQIQQIHGAGIWKMCALSDTACTFNVTGLECSNSSGNCTSPGTGCGNGSCSGGNNYECENNETAEAEYYTCNYLTATYCCTATMSSSCQQFTSPANCTCTGPAEDKSVSNRHQCQTID